MFLRKKAIFFSLVGHIIEYYDYALYGFLATEISHHFFPYEANASVALLRAYGVFSLGAFAKPLGNLVFSHIGDTLGRVCALRGSMALIFCSTLGLGLLPSYQEWGLFSLLGLVFFRFLQGFALGGESDGINLLVSEHLGKSHKHMAIGLSGLSSSLGIFFASYAASLILENKILNWQILYLCGASFSFVILIFRKFLQEAEVFHRSKREAPIKMKILFRKNWLLIGSLMLFMGANGGLYHYYILFLNTYVADFLGIFTQKEGAKMSYYATFGYAISGILIGWIADKYAHINLSWSLLFGIFCVLILTTLSILLKIPVYSVYALGGFLIGGSGLPPLARLLHSIDVQKRFRLIGSAHVLGSSLISGTTPFLCTKLYQLHPKLPLFQPFFLLFLYILGCLGLVLLEKKDQSRVCN